MIRAKTYPGSGARLLRSRMTAKGRRLLKHLLLLLLVLIFIVLWGPSAGLWSTTLLPLADQPLQHSNSVAVVIVSDAGFNGKYSSQAKSIQCYAQQHGYHFFMLQPAIVAPLCQKHHHDFFFRKHCAVSHWLRSRPHGSVAVVLDGDVVGGTSNRSLSRWLSYDFDLAFYERSWNFEITSGNYLVRNTQFSRMFLLKWASYEFAMPTGFSSSDNGAIHLAILDALAVRKRQLCRDQYRRLESGVSDLSSYYMFVACTRELLGPPRSHIAYARDSSLRKNINQSVEEKQRKVGKITIFPRFFGFAVDPKPHGYTSRRNLHPFHHGIKNSNWHLAYVKNPDKEGYSTCKPFLGIDMSDERMGEAIKQSDYTMMHSPFKEASHVPRWKQPDEQCYARLWCAPLESEVDVWPAGIVSENGTVRNYTYVDPGIDWYNEFAAGVYGV